MNFWGNLFGRKNHEAMLTALDREKAQERWRWVQDQLELGKPNNLKLAIIEADKIIDETLKALYPDESDLAGRLKRAQSKFIYRQEYDDLWYAHKVRNIVVHEISYDLPSHEAKSVIEKYKKSLEILGVL